MKARKILVSVAALALVAAISIGGTLAYLTSQATVTNTFSVGNIKITLDEAQLDKDGMNLLNKDNKVVTDVALAARTNENTYKLMPGHTYDWQRASFCADNEGALTGAQFRIHPLTCTLTISKSGWVSIDENQSFLFKYQRTGGNSVGTAIEGVVTVQGNESVQITGLPIGTYQVSEDENWSWRYTPKTKSQSATLTTAAPAAALTFENSRSKILWLNGCSWAVNNWNNTEATKSPATPGKTN